MRERIESKHVTKEIKSQMPVIPVEIVKERGCTFCPYYLGNYEKQPRCMMKTCAWDDENERFHPVLRELIPYYKEKMEKAEEKFLAMKKIYTTLLGMFADEMKQEEFAAKSVSLVKEKCVSECEVYAYDNMGHSEVLSLHPEKLCEIIRK